MSNVKEIVLKHFPQERPNGDRATTKTPCHRYELWLTDGLHGGECVLVDTADDWDSFHCSVDDRRAAYHELKQKANSMAGFFLVTVREVHMELKVVKQETWVEAGDDHG